MKILKKQREKSEKSEKPQTTLYSYFLIKNSEKKTSQISQATFNKTLSSQISLTSRPHATFFCGSFLTFHRFFLPTAIYLLPTILTQSIL